MSVASEAEFVGSLCTRLSTGVNVVVAPILGYAPRVTWPDQTALKPLAGRVRARLGYRNTKTRQTSLGQPPRFTTAGAFFVQLYAPSSSAAARGLLLATAEAIASMYRGVTEPTGVWYKDVTIVAQPASTEWTTTRVVGNYQYDLYGVGSAPGVPVIGNGISPPGVIVYTADVAISGETPVMLIADGNVIPANIASPEYAYAGVTLTAVAAGGQVAVRLNGLIFSDTWNWQPGLPIFVSASGTLTQVVPVSGLSHNIGTALDQTTLYLNANDPITIVGG